MILRTYFRDELIERIKKEPDETFDGTGFDKDDILNDDDTIDKLWGLYQKSIEEYDVDEDYAYGDAMHDVLGINVDGWEG